MNSPSTIVDNDLNDAINRVEVESKKHIDLLNNLSMKVNTYKTEIVIFSKQPHKAEIMMGTSLMSQKLT